jgi:DNA repair protein RadD
MFAHIAHRAAQRGKRVLILVHRQELVRQTVAKLGEYGVEPDLITAGTREVARGHVAVASVQTLARRLHQYPDDCWDLVVQDEAHHAVAPTFKRVLDAFPRAYQLGVTATPRGSTAAAWTPATTCCSRGRRCAGSSRAAGWPTTGCSRTPEHRT